jgi:type II secretion system protein H
MPHPSRDSGFTLIEAVVTMALLGTMMAIAVGGWSSWARAKEQSGAAYELQSLLRQAQQRAVTEGRSMCVLFEPATDQYTVYRGTCDAADKVKVQGPLTSGSPSVHLTSPAFVSPSASDNAGVSFTARGTAWPGEVRITRTGSSKVYTVRVEGLTGHVSLS